MSTNRQRRESERLQLQRQLEERRRRDASRKRTNTIIGAVGAVVLVAAVVVIVIVATSGSSSKKKPDAQSKGSPTTQPTTSAPTSAAAPACGQQTFPATKTVAATGAAVTFDGVTVKGAADLKGQPGVTSKGGATPTKLEYKDLVVGKGTPATPTSCVTVQYDGVLYTNGKEFDSSWQRGMLAQFPLTGVVPGFTQGIGGTTGVPPMRIGGRRLMILPAALGYGANSPDPTTIPNNAALVFVVDLTAVKAS